MPVLGIGFPPPLGAGMSGCTRGWVVSRPGSAGKGDKTPQPGTGPWAQG
jgi:hypothetical protein